MGLRAEGAAREPRPTPPNSPNHVRAIDFVDTLADGRTIKCLTVIDEWTRESLASGIRAARVVEVLTRVVSVRGAPRSLRCDNGPEFVSRALLRWMLQEGIETAFIDPGKPELQRPLSRRVPGHGVVPFARRSQGGHRSLAQALQQRSTHSSLGGISPSVFMKKYEKSNPERLASHCRRDMRRKRSRPPRVPNRRPDSPRFDARQANQTAFAAELLPPTVGQARTSSGGYAVTTNSARVRTPCYPIRSTEPVD
jgi:hypothetical protein